MKSRVTWYSFADAFKACGRESQFSRPALAALFDYLEDYEDQTGEEIELDVVGLCCEFAEHDSILCAAKEYGYKVGIDDRDETPLDWLQNRTTVIEVPNETCVVIRSF